MSRRLLTRLGLILAGAFLAAYLASPVFAVRSLINAARTGDEARLERLVDFPAVRDDLKAQLNAQLVRRVRADPELRDNPLSGLGLVLAPALLSGVVDAFVTPEAIAAMVQTAEAPDLIGADGAPLLEAPPERAKDIRIGYSYRGLNRFAGTLTDRARPHERIDLIMERRGVFGWKLTQVRLPREWPEPRNEG